MPDSRPPTVLEWMSWMARHESTRQMYARGVVLTDYDEDRIKSRRDDHGTFFKNEHPYEAPRCMEHGREIIRCTNACDSRLITIHAWLPHRAEDGAP